ncbi:helix-turn-helix transcriptional regulator [Roseibium sp. AS2]|uniref:helix-turn-helix transcriptional regulator n=1 Tax=Roseibium sp. AS2 TaxID=3135781 RepID=UPI00317B3207
MVAQDSALVSLIRFESIQSGLRPRTFSAGAGSFADFNLFAIVARGRADVLSEDAEVEVEIESHAVLILPHGQPAQIRVPAGTRAWLVGFARPLQPLIVGSGTESLMLNMVLGRMTLTPGNRDVVERSILPLLPLLADELADPAKRSQAAAAALFRLLLIAASRMLIGDELVEGTNDIHILHRFRQLVELGYRSRRKVNDYCQDLNLSYDRLHDICQRNLNRTPLSLVHQRILLDATTWLRQSDESIHSISQRLGFNDPTRFSHFFKRAMQVSPYQFRTMAHAERTSQQGAALGEFADWP